MNLSIKSVRFKILVPWQRQIRLESNVIISADKTDDESKFVELKEKDVTIKSEDSDELEQIIEQKRNKSRLLPQHRNMLYNKVPYSEPQSWIHETVKYQRTMFGRYGKTSGVHPGICWPTNEDLANIKSYEQVAYPHTIQEMIQMNKQQQVERENEIQRRQEEISKKVAKLDQWKEELTTKIAKKEMEAQKVKERKERLIEEVRRHFGYTVDPRDERFKEMLEKKEKEQKKIEKEAKRQAKQMKQIAKLQQQIETQQDKTKTDTNTDKQ